MSSNFHVNGTITFEVGGWIQATDADEAMKDFMVMVQMFIHEGMRADDMVADFRWTNMMVLPPPLTAPVSTGPAPEPQ